MQRTCKILPSKLFFIARLSFSEANGTSCKYSFTYTKISFFLSFLCGAIYFKLVSESESLGSQVWKVLLLFFEYEENVSGR